MIPVGLYPTGHALDVHHAAQLSTFNPPLQADTVPASNDALVRALTSQINNALEATQNALFTRLAAQDALVARQQDTLEAISRSLSAVHGEVTESHETTKIEVYDIRAQIEKLGKGLGDSMKMLISGMLKAIRQGEATNTERWSAIEESLEGLREDIKDPHADCKSIATRERHYQDASVACIPSRFLSASTSHVEPLGPPRDDHDPADLDAELVYEQNPDNTISAEMGELPPESDVGRDSDIPLPTPQYAPSTMYHGLAGEEGAEDGIDIGHTQGSEGPEISDLEVVASPHERDPELTLEASPDPTAGSAPSVMSSLPDPKSLLLSVISDFEVTHPEALVAPLADTKLAVAGFAARSRSASLLSLSTLSSVPEGDAPTPSKVASGSTPSGLKKRRRSSPGPACSKIGKRHRTGMTKKVKRELMECVGPLKKQRARCAWPRKASNTTESRQFIQCDKCELWYHWGCVAIKKHDARLGNDQEFICPPCGANIVQDSRRHAKDGKQDKCFRPDCNINDDPDEDYVIERIIGRFNHQTPGIKSFSWLIKWDGYPADQCTWLHEKDIGDTAKLIEDFGEATAIEGLEVQGKGLVLLKEAVDAGWLHRRS